MICMDLNEHYQGPIYNLIFIDLDIDLALQVTKNIDIMLPCYSEISLLFCAHFHIIYSSLPTPSPLSPGSPIPTRILHGLSRPPTSFYPFSLFPFQRSHTTPLYTPTTVVNLCLLLSSLISNRVIPDSLCYFKTQLSFLLEGGKSSFV